MDQRVFAKRLDIACAAWGFDDAALAVRAGVLPSKIERARSGDGNRPSREDVKRSADALRVDEEWLLTGDGPMVPLWEMSVEDQFEAHTGPGSEGLPDYVIVAPGPWFRVGDGNWKVA